MAVTIVKLKGKIISKFVNIVLVDVIAAVNFLEQAKERAGKCSVEIFLIFFFLFFFVCVCVN